MNLKKINYYNMPVIPTTWEAEAELHRFKACLGLHSGFKASLSNVAGFLRRNWGENGRKRGGRQRRRRGEVGGGGDGRKEVKAGKGRRVTNVVTGSLKIEARRSQVWGQPWLHSKTLSGRKERK